MLNIPDDMSRSVRSDIILNYNEVISLAKPYAIYMDQGSRTAYHFGWQSCSIEHKKVNLTTQRRFNPNNDSTSFVIESFSVI
ncbi:hypothetical protein CDAR_13101 [Caerostris darwini]|uniref:Uncharacterized protein n=1 Tax=Caerostris darwini TaxID=1538125 RepID=A0AAV4Q508_9ARAC|nr:hypothetical protein CDAR_13101 [Caerostris darwini]